MSLSPELIDGDTPSRSASTRVHILVFDGVEVLDFAGPYEVFTTASRVHGRTAPAAPPLFEVACVSRDGAAVQARAGLRVLPERGFEGSPPPDWLVVPGGVMDEPLACPRTLAWVAATARQAQLTASVCTGAFVLATSGVVTDGEVTTHWEDVADLRTGFPGLRVLEGRRWVDRGRLVTSAGISAGIDMSLHLVARWAGQALAERTARQMDYRWVADEPA
ncbi:MAG: DJ-1/PfpI family protein [Ramlibacter sp.]|nr:DJ-1/PfpI family protein [Ramlibacter sp.]